MALTGPDLLAKVKELGNVSKSELVRACGFTSSKKDGSERLNFTAFYEALLEAKGVSLDGDASQKSTSGRKLRFVTRVQFNGNLLVGKAYTAMLGLAPGEEFEVRLNVKKRSIRLVPVGSEPDASESNGEPEIEIHSAEEVPTLIAEGDTVETVELTEKDLALAAV